MTTTLSVARASYATHGIRCKTVFTRDGKRVMIWFGWPCAALLFLASVPLAYEWNFGYHAQPKPPGRVLGVRIGGDLWCGQIGQRVRVEVAQRSPAILALHDVEQPPFGESEWPTHRHGTLWIEYPSGRRLPVEHQIPAAKLPFDFDADGVEDRVANTPGPGKALRAEVLSGATDAVLYRYDDRYEAPYSQSTRAFPLGDLDGDGYAELALLHPRCNRTDEGVLVDFVLGARSWLTVVSGSAARPEH
jgi:hypothetical protein